MESCHPKMLQVRAGMLDAPAVPAKPTHPWMFAVAVASAPPLPGYANTAWAPYIDGMGAYAQDTQPVPEDLHGVSEDVDHIRSCKGNRLPATIARKT